MAIDAQPPTSFKMNNGQSIPAVGLGTWQGKHFHSHVPNLRMLILPPAKAKPGEVKDAVKHALSVGYRHIDGALIYQNEEEVGQGVKESGVPREEVFLTSKV